MDIYTTTEEENKYKIKEYLQSTNIDIRKVSYIACSEAIADIIINHKVMNKDINLPLVIKKMVNYVCELAILDRTLIEKCILHSVNFRRDILEYDRSSKRYDNLNTGCFYSFLGVNTYYGDNDVKIINKYKDIFKRINMLSYSVMEGCAL
jgi:hypothetical protein